MCPTLKKQLYLVACVVGILLAGALGAPGKVEHHTKNGGQHNRNYSKDQDNQYHIMLDLQPRVSSGSIRPINNDSISPWEYEYNHDDNQIPSTIAVAKCLLIGCLNLKGEEILDLESRPIYREILVLRRVHGNGNSYHFQPELKNIAVGCTCVRPDVNHI